VQRNALAYTAAALVLAAIAALTPPYMRFLIERIAIAGLFAVGFNLVFGLAGISSLGNAAFYGTGAYVAGIVGAQHGAAWFVVVPFAVALGTVLGATFGVFTARVRGIYALLLTLTLAQSLWGLASQNVALTQGDTGITGITGAMPLAIGDPRSGAMIVLVAALGGAVAWLMWTSTYGLMIVATATNEVRARALGLSIVRPRVIAFALSGALCALAGVMSAQLRGSVSPSDLDWPTSATVLIAALLGGTRTAFGPLLGALILVAAETLLGDLTGRWELILGAFMAFVAIVLPGGVIRARNRRLPHGVPCAIAPPRPAPAGLILQIDHLNYAIGGRALFADFSLSIAAGERHAIVGPNGVGKSTLFAIIGGDRRPDSGTIRLGGLDVSAQTTAQRARAGIGRTYQFGSLFDDRTVWENLAIAHAVARHGSFAIAGPLVSDAVVLGAVRASLARFGIEEIADARVGDIAYGTRRRVEIAVAFATDPRLVLLDEPTAGLERNEIAEVVAAIESLPREVALLVIEHDADVAARLCSRTTQLGGRIDADSA